MTPAISTKLVNITPAMAREYLKKNTANRPIRNSHVETLRASYERGEYMMTHQGIAFDSDGTLLDGQHRLTAISLLNSGSFPMLVSTGFDRGTVFPVIDAVQAKRTTSDVLGVDPGLGQLGNYIAKLYDGRGNRVTPVYAEQFTLWIQPEYESLVAFCGTSCKTWSSAPVRAAACISIKLGIDADYVRLIYAALVRSDFSSMPPIVQALYKAQVNGAVRAGAASDIFCRCLKAFDPKNAKLARVQINDIQGALSSVREFIAKELITEKKRAPVSARKSVAGANYRIEGL